MNFDRPAKQPLKRLDLFNHYIAWITIARQVPAWFMKARALVGRNMRRLRVGKGLSQEALGLAAGCEPSYIGRVERGRENPTVDLLEAVAAALGDPLAAFFDKAGERGPLKAGLPAGRKPRGAKPPKSTAGRPGPR